MTTNEQTCPDSCNEKVLDGQIFAGGTKQERERHRARANRVRVSEARAHAVQLAEARSVLQHRGIDLELGGGVLADGLRRNAEAVMAMATVVAHIVGESGVEAVAEMRAEHARIVHLLAGERDDAIRSLQQAERRRVALSAQLLAVEDELSTARVEARARQGCEEELQVSLADAGTEGRRVVSELEDVQAEASRLAFELAAVTATRDEAVAGREDLARRHEQVVDRERQAREDAASMRVELGRVASTVAGELRAVSTIATAEQALAVREAQVECRREIADLRAQVDRLTRDGSCGETPTALIVARR